MSITRIFRGTAMDLEQERKFEQVLEQRCWRYFCRLEFRSFFLRFTI